MQNTLGLVYPEKNYDMSKLEVRENFHVLALLLSVWGFEWVQGRNFFESPTLTGHIFAASYAMVIDAF